MPKVVLITGCSSGIGLATAVLLAKNNNKVYATMRDLSKKKNLENEAKKNNVNVNILELDVTKEDTIKNAVNAVIKKEGKIDVLINNAGYGLLGPLETVSMEKAREQFEANFFGLIRVTKEILPYMRKQKSGHIINMSSIAGVRGFVGMDLYCASKFAVEGLSESMAPLLSTLGIKISIIEPGPVGTEFLSTLNKDYEIKEDDYKKIMEKMIANRAERFKTAQPPEEIAEIINKAITAENPNLRYQTSEWVRETVKDERNDLTGNTYLENVKKLINE